MVLDRDDFADLVHAGVHTGGVEGLDGVHVDDAGLHAGLRQLIRGFQSETDRIAVCDDGHIAAPAKKLALADLKLLVLIIDHGDGVAGKTQIDGAIGLCRRLDERLCRGIVCRHHNRHVRDGAQDAHILDGLVGSAVICRSHTAVGAGDLHVQVGVADLLADHLADAHGAESRIGDHKRDLPTGRKACCHTSAVLLGDANVQILIGQLLAEITGFTGLADVNIDDHNILVLSAELNNGFTEAVTSGDLFRFHAQASSLI